MVAVETRGAERHVWIPPVEWKVPSLHTSAGPAHHGCMDGAVVQVPDRSRLRTQVPQVENDREPHESKQQKSRSPAAFREELLALSICVLRHVRALLSTSPSAGV